MKASTVIQTSVGKWIDTDALAQVEEQEEAISQRFMAEIPELIKKLG